VPCSEVVLLKRALPVHVLVGWLQFLGFSSTSNDSPGRRAATIADLKTYRDSVDPVQDQTEKDSLLRQVWCRL